MDKPDKVSTSGRTARRDVRTHAIEVPIGRGWLIADLSECLYKQLRMLADDRPLAPRTIPVTAS